MVSFPRCKINLGLQVLSKRPDGFHNIATCFYPVPWEDVLEILPSPSLSFISTGNDIPGEWADNLCVKAYQLLKADCDLPPVQIHLHKNIPIGAGLGGGSSDGSYTLKCLNTLFNLNLSQAQLMKFSATLGSDCAFFIQDMMMLGSGRGDSLEPVAINLKGFYLRIFVPDIQISTAAAFAGVVPGKPTDSLRDVLQQPISAWKEKLKNDFENSVFLRYPELGVMKNELYAHGAAYASMSGSGSSVYGIFENDLPIKCSTKESWSGWL